MPTKPRKDRFYAEIDRGYSRAQALKRAGYQPSNPRVAASMAHRLLSERHGPIPKGFDRLPERLQAIWKSLSPDDRAGLENLPRGETLKENLEVYANPKKHRQPPLPPLPQPTPPTPPPVPTPEPEPHPWAFPIAGYGFIEPASKPFEEIDGNCGLPFDFILGLSETAYQDRPVENGLWVDGNFTSDSDRIDQEFARRQAERTIESRRIISNSEVLRKR
jgi:hypothetical protein